MFQFHPVTFLRAKLGTAGSPAIAILQWLRIREALAPKHPSKQHSVMTNKKGSIICFPVYITDLGPPWFSRSERLKYVAGYEAISTTQTLHVALKQG